MTNKLRSLLHSSHRRSRSAASRETLHNKRFSGSSGAYEDRDEMRGASDLMAARFRSSRD